MTADGMVLIRVIEAATGLERSVPAFVESDGEGKTLTPAEPLEVRSGDTVEFTFGAATVMDAG